MGISDVNVNMWGFKIDTETCPYGYQYYDIANNPSYTSLNIEPDYNHITNWGSATEKVFQIDLDSEFAGMPSIIAGWEEDTIFCNAEGIPSSSPVYVKKTVQMNNDEGQTVNVNMYELYLRVEFLLVFRADLQYVPYNGYFQSIIGEVEGQVEVVGGSNSVYVGGSETEGLIVFQIDASQDILGIKDEDDYNYMDSTVIDVECIGKTERFSVRHLNPDSFEILTSAFGDTSDNPYGTGIYKVVPIIGDMLFYRNLQDAQHLSSPIGRRTLEDCTPADFFEQKVYVPIDFQVKMGSNTQAYGFNAQFVSDFQFVGEYKVHLDYIYTVFTAYTDIFLDSDNDSTDEDFLSIGQKLEMFFIDLWSTSIGKIFIVGALLFVGLGIYKPISLVKNRKSKPSTSGTDVTNIKISVGEKIKTYGKKAYGKIKGVPKATYNKLKSAYAKLKEKTRKRKMQRKTRKRRGKR
jgi:hypothetical protein